MRMTGISHSRVQKDWSITNAGDTLRNVTRLSWTLNMSYADPEQIDANLPDSIASDLISEMQVDVRAVLAERLLTVRSMYFAEDARYPVLTDSRTSRVIRNSASELADTNPFSQIALYYPSQSQYWDTGIHDHTLRYTLKEAFNHHAYNDDDSLCISSGQRDDTHHA